MENSNPKLAGIARAACRWSRSAMLVALVAMWTSEPASADVRHPSYPKRLQGTWSPSAEQCGTDSSSRIVIGEKRVVGPKVECAVEYVAERAGPRGPIYSGRGSCIDRAPPQNKSMMNLVIEPRIDGTTWIGTTFEKLQQYQLCNKIP